MNMFKGLMFLQGHFTRAEDLEESRTEYGARTAAADFGPALGNRAASAAWFALGGRQPASRTESATQIPAERPRDRRHGERRANNGAQAQACSC